MRDGEITPRQPGDLCRRSPPGLQVAPPRKKIVVPVEGGGIGKEDPRMGGAGWIEFQIHVPQAVFESQLFFCTREGGGG